MSYSERVHSISLQIYVIFLFLQSYWPVFFIIFASNVQIVFAKSISKSPYIDGVIISRHVPSFSTRCIKPLVVNCFNCLFIAATLMPTSSDSFCMVMSGTAYIRLRILLVELLRKITRSPSNHHTLSPLSVRKRMSCTLSIAIVNLQDFTAKGI